MRLLAHMQEGQVCSVTVGVLGDICRAVESQVAPYCNAIMQILLENLADQAVSRDLKPQILSAFGDVALALGDQFEPYLIHVTGVGPACRWHNCMTAQMLIMACRLISCGSGTDLPSAALCYCLSTSLYLIFLSYNKQCTRVSVRHLSCICCQGPGKLVDQAELQYCCTDALQRSAAKHQPATAQR